MGNKWISGAAFVALLTIFFAFQNCGPATGFRGAASTRGAGDPPPPPPPPPPQVKWPRVVVGPIPFAFPFSPTNMREDFKDIYRAPETWQFVSDNSDYFELYIMMLGFHQQNPFFDLDAMVRILREKKKKVIFQAGSFLFSTPTGCEPGMGSYSANQEFNVLKLWIDADGGRGQIDQITLDNAYGRILNALDSRCAAWTWEQKFAYIKNEIAGYITRYHEIFPAARFAITDGLAAFKVTAPDGIVYLPTVASLPTTVLSEYLGGVKTALGPNASVLEEFVIDFFDAVEWDAGVYPTSAYILEGVNYGRILAAEAAIREVGLKAGVYFNAFPTANASAPPPNPSQGSQVVKTRTLKFMNGLLHFGGEPDAYRFVYWHEYPKQTGPESLDSSAFNIFKDAIQQMPSSP